MFGYALADGRIGTRDEHASRWTQGPGSPPLDPPPPPILDGVFPRHVHDAILYTLLSCACVPKQTEGGGFNAGHFYPVVQQAIDEFREIAEGLEATGELPAQPGPQSGPRPAAPPPPRRRAPRPARQARPWLARKLAECVDGPWQAMKTVRWVVDTHPAAFDIVLAERQRGCVSLLEEAVGACLAIAPTSDFVDSFVVPKLNEYIRSLSPEYRGPKRPSTADPSSR